LTTEQKAVLSDTYKKRIIRQLLYYDIFDHLLTEEELIKDCSIDDNFSLNELIKEGLIFKLDGCLAIKNKPELVKKRQRGEENTQKSMPRAIKMAKLISKFPFVRSVSLSGSISKGYMDSFKDVDYFIITKPGRLWLSRTLLVFYKKIFLLDSFRYFCLNYFIDENNLHINDQNIFTATEINTLIPIYGTDLAQSFNASNEWVRKYYPDFPQKRFSGDNGIAEPAGKKIIEFLLSNFLGNWLDIFSMKLTVFYWKRKYKGKQSYLFKSSFRFRRDEAKYHPGNFQQLVLEKFNSNIDRYEKKMKVRLNEKD